MYATTDLMHCSTPKVGSLHRMSRQEMHLALPDLWLGTPACFGDLLKLSVATTSLPAITLG